jgi:hypothetical protein
MTSNFQQIREHGILKADPMLDRKDWTYDRRGEIVARYKNKVAGNKTGRYKEIRKPLPTPLETRLALQSRLIIADRERAAWVEANREKIIAAAKAELKSKINNN